MCTVHTTYVQAIKPPATQKNKYPGSTLRYIYNTTTVYEFAGSNYVIDTQVRGGMALVEGLSRRGLPLAAPSLTRVGPSP